MKQRRPDQHACELGQLWRLLTTDNQQSWLRMAQAMRDKHAPDEFARIIDTASVLAFFLMLIFPMGLKFTILAISAGYVLAVNWAIVRVCWQGVRG